MSKQATNAVSDVETIIGLEIHVQLKTKSKMFCTCENIFGDVPPNTAICPLCLGYPGTLPLPNAQAIKLAQKVGAALNCELAKVSKFDRKHYFYPDLPKGYQISQFDQPFCGLGHLSIEHEGEILKIGITRAHLEEDAAKNTHPADAKYTLVDYNRAGTPLLEIVTEPDLRSPAAAKAFLQELRLIMRTLDVSDADMEKGQLRCDANISVRRTGETSFNPKTEIKNLNSFKHVEKALEFEHQRLLLLLEQDDLPTEDTTRGYHADTNTTTEHRTKEGAADYRYFPEPDIPPFIFSPEELAAAGADLPELPAAKRYRFIEQYKLSADQAALISSQDLFANYFENVVSEIKQFVREEGIDTDQISHLIKKALNIINRELRNLITNRNLDAASLRISEANFAELVVLVDKSQTVAGNTSEILQAMQNTGGDPDHVIGDLGLSLDEKQFDLDDIIEQVISVHPDVVEKIKSGKDSALQFLLGQVMAQTKGAASPAIVIPKLRDKLGVDK